MTQKKKKTVRHIIIGIGLLWLIIIIAALVLFRNELRSLMSLEKVDKYGMYQMTYYGDYATKFQEFNVRPRLLSSDISFSILYRA